MRNRVALGASLVSMVLAAACGSKKTEAPAGEGTASGAAGSAGSAAERAGEAGSAAAGAAQAAYCVAGEAGHVLAAFVADDKAATFCLEKEDDEQGAPRCTTVDLATGAYSAAPAAPAGPAAPAAALTIKQDPGGVQACKGAACKPLDLPKPKEGEEEAGYHVAVSSDGKRVAASGGELGGVVILDGATGKKVKAVKLGDDHTCVEGAHFVGDALYVATSNCVGPGGAAALYSLTGKKIGDVATEETINTYGAEPIHVGGAHWAVAGYGGGAVLVFDAGTGKQVHLVEVKQPEGCARCGEVLGTAAHWSAAPIAKLPSGKLATISGTGVSIIDPVAGKVEQTHRMPICAAAK